MSEKLLFVDDDPSILSGLRRQLALEGYRIDTADSGEAGLLALAEDGPYAVVVSDMRMPGMNGATFLSRVQDRSPDSVRILLTGYAEVDAAIAAVNEGNIFRFLTKPIQTGDLVKSLEAAMQMYRLVTAERVLLQNTLSGSIKVLTDVLALVNPVAFSRAARLRQHVRQMLTRLNIPNQWQFELAAILSQLGCVVMPRDLLEKVYVGTDLDNDEKERFGKHPSIAHDLLVNIPRLESIAEMIANQLVPYKKLQSMSHKNDAVVLGAQMLNAALAIEQRMTAGLSYNEAIAELCADSDMYGPVILGALGDESISQPKRVTQMVKLQEIRPGMILEEDVRGADGLLLLARGQEFTKAALDLLIGWSEIGQVPQALRVYVPHDNNCPHYSRGA